VPISQQTFTDADLIAFANEEMGITLVPQIQQIREDLFLNSKIIPIVTGVTKYVLPERAIGNAIKSVVIGSDPNTKHEIPRIDSVRSFGGPIDGESDSFYLEDNYVVINPTPNSAEDLEIWYYSRPNELVPTSECAKITSIASAGGSTTYTVDTNLTGSLSVGDKIDILSDVSPFILWGTDVEVTDVTSTTIEVDTADITNEADVEKPQVNDYICLSKTSNIPMVPQEFHPILAQLVACRTLEALGDLNKLQAALAKLNTMMENAKTLIANRVETSTQYFNNRNGFLSSTWRSGKRTFSV
jgi:hypothetical protein